MRMRCTLPVANILYLLYSTGRNQQWNHWPNSYSVFTSLRKYKEWLYWSLWKQIRMAEQYVAPWQECFCMQYMRHSIIIFSTLCFTLHITTSPSKPRPASEPCQKGGPKEGDFVTSHASKQLTLGERWTSPLGHRQEQQEAVLGSKEPFKPKPLVCA